MKHLSLAGIFIVLFILVFACKEKAIEPTLLFTENGNDWTRGGEAEWKFTNHELIGTAKGNGGYVMTNEKFRDFVLELEFFPDSTINSGVFVRCKDREISNIECYEMNIWDLHPDQNSRTGAIVTRSVPLANVATLGKFNTYKIRCDGYHIQTWVNGDLTADIENPDLMEGYIGLQAAEKGMIKFRNVMIRPIP